jgi:hypothetical protein
VRSRYQEDGPGGPLQVAQEYLRLGRLVDRMLMYITHHADNLVAGIFIALAPFDFQRLTDRVVMREKAARQGLIDDDMVGVLRGDLVRRTPGRATSEYCRYRKFKICRNGGAPDYRDRKSLPK